MCRSNLRFASFAVHVAEYDILTAMIESSMATAAPLPDQISLELHAASGSALPGDLMGGRGGMRYDGGLSPFIRSVKAPGELALFGSYLFSSGGYVIVDRRDHPTCDMCTELVLARLFCAGSGGMPSK